MIEKSAVAHCIICGDAYHPKRLEIPHREDRDAPISAMIIYPSGCHCGLFYTKLLTETEIRKLNLPPKKWKK